MFWGVVAVAAATRHFAPLARRATPALEQASRVAEGARAPGAPGAFLPARAPLATPAQVEPILQEAQLRGRWPKAGKALDIARSPPKFNLILS